MRTPCQEAPEAWVGDDKALRAQAAQDCRTKCPVFAQCLAGKFGTPDSGVWAGTDYADGKPTRLVAKTCQTCDKPVSRSRSKFCSPECYHASNVKDAGLNEKPCAHCGETFRRTYHNPKKWAGARFCSVSCARNASVARKQAKEVAA